MRYVCGRILGSKLRCCCLVGSGNIWSKRVRVGISGLWVRGVRRWNGERREWTSKHRVKIQIQDRDALIFSSPSLLRFRHPPFPTPFRPFNSQSYSHYNHLILILLLYLARGDSSIPTCVRRFAHCSSSHMPQNLFEYPRLSVFFRERTLWDLSWSHHKSTTTKVLTIPD